MNVFNAADRLSAYANENADTQLVAIIDGKLMHLDVLGIRSPYGNDRVLVLTPTFEYEYGVAMGRDLMRSQWIKGETP